MTNWLWSVPLRVSADTICGIWPSSGVSFSSVRVLDWPPNQVCAIDAVICGASAGFSGRTATGAGAGSAANCTRTRSASAPCG